MMRRHLWLLAVAVLFDLSSAAQTQRPKQGPRLPEGTKAHRDLEYVKGGHERNKLDLYLPAKADGPLPVIVWIHGGAWLGGNKDNPPALPFVARGYAVASINYRLSQHAKFPAQIEDCKAAIRWLRANAQTYHLDPNRIGVWGASAGGHLVALLGTTGGVKELEGQGGNAEQSSRVQAVVDWFGPTDLVKIGGQAGPDSQLDHNAADSPEAKLLGGPVPENKDKAAKASPVTYVRKDAAPFLIMHGDKDRIVPYAQSEELAAALKKAGAQVTLKKIEGAGHGGEEFASPENRRLIVEFFDKYLKKASAKERTPSATPAAALQVLKDFKAELLYSVPKDKQGSWVNLCVDPKSRLIVSDQYGPLYRITPPPLTLPSPPLGGEGRVRGGSRSEETKVEKLDLPFGGAHGLLWAFDSLYVMVNERVNLGGTRPRQGLHRIRSKDGGDTFEKPEFLHEVRGEGEHGSHAILPGPDGKSLYIVCGNMTRMVSPLAGSRVPKLWGEDHLLPRLPDGNGFMRGVLGPGGCIYKVDPDGKNWELISTGYRNQFDAAFNRQGELFTYDADMEWDMNTPWYRPTRVCLVASGSEFGWRNGAGKWPAYYPDSLPAVYNIGPGSPTGVCFGYGAHFPAKYQEALFLCDWSYGKMYAVHLTPDGSAYKGEAEEFLSGSPLPLTDVVINPKDGALYFTIGGRKTQSGLYRITYTGKESTEPASNGDTGAEARALRHRLEAFHGKADPKAVETAWPYLNHADRYIRFAARTAIEHQDPKTWQERALKETDPARAINALLALVRATGQDPFHHPRKPSEPVPGAALKGPILTALGRIDWKKLTEFQRLDLLRVYAVLFNRMGWPDRTERARVIQRFDPLFPAKGREMNAELGQLLVYLEAPGVAAKALRLMAEAPTQEEQLEYARSLRVLETGWTLPQRNEYFAWYLRAANYKGGASLRGFLRLMKNDAVATLTEKEKGELRPILESKPVAATPIVGKPRPFVKQWKLDELAPIVEKGLTKRDFDRGRRLFGEARCFACHRFDNEGGAQGPDLTAASGRFSVRDLLESIVEPSKQISDQYAAVVITTTDGKVTTGRIVNYFDDNMSVMTNMLDPNGLINVSAKKVDSVEKSKVSMMPAGLLDTFKEDEILDLVAYLLSRGDRSNKMFRK
jgi:putative heme-binding domain-containing protein